MLWPDQQQKLFGVTIPMLLDGGTGFHARIDSGDVEYRRSVGEHVYKASNWL